MKQSKNQQTGAEARCISQAEASAQQGLLTALSLLFPAGVITQQMPWPDVRVRGTQHPAAAVPDHTPSCHTVFALPAGFLVGIHHTRETVHAFDAAVPCPQEVELCLMSAHCLQATTQEVHIEYFTHDDVLLMLQWMYGRLQSIPENHAQASPNLLGTRMLVVDKKAYVPGSAAVSALQVLHA